MLSQLTIEVTERAGTVRMLEWKKETTAVHDDSIITGNGSPNGPSSNGYAGENGNGHFNGNGHSNGNAHSNGNGHTNGNGTPHAEPPSEEPDEKISPWYSGIGLSETKTDAQRARSSKLAAIVPIRQRRVGPPLMAHVEAVADSMETASHRIGLFARLMDEHSIAELSQDESRAKAPGSDAVPAAAAAAQPGADSQVGFNPGTLPADSTFGADLKIALVHDFLYCYAGAEHVLEQILAVFPHADIFSLFDFLGPNDRGFLLNKPVKTSFIQKMPWARTKHRHYLPLMPLAIEQLDVSEYDLVISSSYVAAKGVITNPGQLHICYCHTPVRFAWDLQHQYLAKSGWNWGLKSVMARMVLHYVRSWDARSSMGVDVFVTNSNFVGSRIEKFYRRKSLTVYPPVDVERFTPSARKEDFYLTVSRLVPYKRIDLIIKAFNQLPDRRLIVVGEGPEMEELKALAGPNIRLVGHQSEERLRQYMRLARAFVFAAEEDFGIVPVEAQAAGTPVIAYGRGGVMESIVSGVTGIFFAEQKPESLIAAVGEFESREWDSDAIRRNAERFSAQRFRRQIRAVVQREWESFKGKKLEGIEIVEPFENTAGRGVPEAGRPEGGRMSAEATAPRWTKIEN
jgi:glycosyltransferase involved in cell wall biosynthesis